MKKVVRKIFKVVHIIFSQIFLIHKLIFELNRFIKIKNNSKTKFNVELQKGDLFFIERSWVKFQENIVNETNNLSYLFFNKPSIIKTMSSDSFFANYKLFLEKSLESLTFVEINKLLNENSVGGPRILLNSIFTTKFKLTSITRAVHIYQLSKLHSIINTHYLNKPITIIEWGGGYGGLCNVFYKHFGFSENTYIIIDIPVSSKIQYHYLATIYGSDKINIIGDNYKIQPGKINLVRLSDLNKLNCKCDIFISSWAISESNKNSQDFVLDKNFYGASYSILFHQLKTMTHPYAEYLSEFLKNNYEVIDSNNVPVYSNQYFIIAKNK